MFVCVFNPQKPGIAMLPKFLLKLEHMVMIRCSLGAPHCRTNPDFYTYTHVDVGQNGRPRGPQMLV